MIGDESRGAQEIIFISLFTIIVLSGAVYAVSATDILIDSTDDQVNPPDFELVDTQHIVFKHVSDDAIRPSTTESIYMVESAELNQYQSEGYEIYPESDLPPDIGGQLNADQVVYNQSLDSTDTFDYGDFVSIVWIREDGGGEVVDEIFIPSEDVTGSTITRGGSETFNGTEIVVEQQDDD